MITGRDTERKAMRKELSDMTLEELWELFPIFLVAHRDEWKDDYRELEAELRKLLSDRFSPRISHIGSTAVSGIWAKNIVDVLVELPDNGDMEQAAQLLARNGFLIMSAEGKRISLNRGYTKDGFAEKVCHIHLRYAGDNDELYFRDYLNEHPEAAAEYEAMKLRLWKKYEHDRDAYTAAKTDFIRRLTAQARRQYGNRYGGSG